MNTRISTLATLVALVASPAFAASDSESWEREFHFERGVVPSLYVRNVWGEVQVTTHRGNSIQLSVRQTRKARNQKALDELDRYLWLETVESEDGVEITLEDTDSDRRWWDRCRGCEFHADLEIRVPVNANVDVGTVMDGTVSVHGVRGLVHARNVNGDVELEGIHQCGEFETVNGELTVAFAELPVGTCRFETVNGDMVVRLPDDGGADVYLDLFNGGVRSDFDVDPLATEARVEKTAAGHGTHYKITQPMGLRVGGGGPEFHFESINGDVDIRRQ